MTPFNLKAKEAIKVIKVKLVNVVNAEFMVNQENEVIEELKVTKVKKEV